MRMAGGDAVVVGSAAKGRDMETINGIRTRNFDIMGIGLAWRKNILGLGHIQTRSLEGR
jgi:hypothetical protein